MGGPGVTYHGGRWDVCATGANGVLRQRTDDNGKWGGWHDVGGSNLAGGVTALYVDGDYHVFAINTAGVLYQLIHTPRGWGSWQNLHGTVHGTPGITYHGRRYDVFAAGANGAIYQQTYQGKWNGWHSIGGSNFNY